MKTLFVTAIVVLLATPSHAQESCTAQAQAKKLAGAAQTSFLTRCHADAEAMCNQAATDRKLNGAARNSFVGSCTAKAN